MTPNNRAVRRIDARGHTCALEPDPNSEKSSRYDRGLAGLRRSYWTSDSPFPLH